MIVFNGKKEAEKILEDLKIQIMKKAASPVLAVVLAGGDLASEIFIKNKKIAAEKIGVRIIECRFSESAKEGEIIDKIRQLNESPEVSGIIVQLPLPKDLNVGRIINEINPKKDVDGFGRETRLQPPLISAVLTALKEFENDIQKKEILAVVNSDIFGATLKKFLIQKKLKANYLLSEDLAEKRNVIQKADVVITALGRPNLIKGDMIKKEVILIDAGIVVLESGKVVGDVDKESIADKASFLTPVPGGIGPLTVAYLLQNVFSAYKQSLMK